LGFAGFPITGSPDHPIIRFSQVSAIARRAGSRFRIALTFDHLLAVRRATDPIRVGYFSGQAKDGEVFAFELEGKDRIPVLEWTAPDQLRISCLRCSNSSIRKREERWQSVRVLFEIAGP